MSHFKKVQHNSGRQRQKFNRNGHSKPKGSKIKKAYIDPIKFIQQAAPKSEEIYSPQYSFNDFMVSDLILNNLQNMGFQQPSPIQDQTIPKAILGQSILGIADTGTGKTAAFAIPLLNRLINEPESKAVILAPTRELAEQIEQQCRLIAKGSNLDGALLIGGTSMNRQYQELKFNPRIIIGTPGRMKDHLTRGSLKISDCNITVLDEVDRMLDMGFVHDITHLLSHVASQRQSFYFSATLDERVRGIIDKFTSDIVHVSVKSGDTSKNVEQNIVAHNSENKIDMLHNILIDETTTKTIIFDDTHRLVEKLSKELSTRGFPVESIHGGKSQSHRQRVLKRFKDNDIQVLVATDVAARGIDVSDITHVINYSLPHSYDDYVHRIGRTGRAGKVGNALTFVEENSLKGRVLLNK